MPVSAAANAISAETCVELTTSVPVRIEEMLLKSGGYAQ